MGAALELFADRGFHGTTMPQIAVIAMSQTGTKVQHTFVLVDRSYGNARGKGIAFIRADIAGVSAEVTG